MKNIVHIRLQKLLFLCDAFLKTTNKKFIIKKHSEIDNMEKYVLYTYLLFLKLPVFILLYK